MCFGRGIKARGARHLEGRIMGVGWDACAVIVVQHALAGCPLCDIKDLAVQAQSHMHRAPAAHKHRLAICEQLLECS